MAWLTLGVAAGIARAAVEFPEGFVGTVTLQPSEGTVGTPVHVTGTGFEPGSTYELVWQTFDGSWNLEYLEGEYTGNFLGRTFKRRGVVLGNVQADELGRFTFAFQVPEDYGGTHDLYVRKVGGPNLNKAGFFIVPHAVVSPLRGPVGTDIHITFTGLNPVHDFEGWYFVTYDNRITGYLTAVTTRGTARAVIPATGEPGPHLIALKRGSVGAPYLAASTSPYRYLPLPEFVFEVTEGEPVLPPPVEAQAPAPVPGVEPAAGGPAIWSDPAEAPVGTPAILRGKGFPAGTRIRLELGSMVGSRVTESGFAPTSSVMAEVEAGADGRFEFRYAFPDALGGVHPVSAWVGERKVASTTVRILPVALGLERAEGPFGTRFALHLKGIGWTQTENIFAVVIDNTYVGYACGFSTNGDVVVPIVASWRPGWHFIDLYPSFYRNTEYSKVQELPFLFRHAILTWQDHPQGFHFRYAFRVTGG